MAKILKLSHLKCVSRPKKKPITVQHLVLLEDYNFLLLIKYFKQYEMLKHRLMERLLYLWLYAVTFKLLNIHNHFKINIQVPFIVYALINLSTQRLRSLWLLSSTESKVWDITPALKGLLPWHTNRQSF